MDQHFVAQVAKKGFFLEQTGGGCTAFFKYLEDEDGVNAPEKMSDNVTVYRYTNRNMDEWIEEFEGSLAEYLQASDLLDDKDANYRGWDYR